MRLLLSVYVMLQATIPQPDDLPVHREFAEFVAEQEGDNFELPVFHSTSGSIYYARSGHLRDATPNNPNLWVRIDHSNDTSTAARETRVLYHAFCSSNRLQRLSHISYAPDGSVLGHRNWNLSASASQHVIPDSLGEEIHRRICEPVPASLPAK